MLLPAPVHGTDWTLQQFGADVLANWLTSAPAGADGISFRWRPFPSGDFSVPDVPGSPGAITLISDAGLGDQFAAEAAWTLGGSRVSDYSSEFTITLI